MRGAVAAAGPAAELVRRHRARNACIMRVRRRRRWPGPGRESAARALVRARVGEGEDTVMERAPMGPGGRAAMHCTRRVVRWLAGRVRARVGSRPCMFDRSGSVCTTGLASLPLFPNGNLWRVLEGRTAKCAPPGTGHERTPAI